MYEQAVQGRIAAGPGTANKSPERDKPAIAVAMTELEENLMTLETLVSRLNERLQPILRQPTTERGDNAPGRPSTSVALADGITSFAGRVQHVTLLLASVSDRIEV